MRWLIIFGASSFGGIFGILLILWAIDGFHGLGLDSAGTVAVVIGVLCTCALGVVLMALIFYSERTNADVAAYRATVNWVGRATKELSGDQKQNDGRS